mgnify:CR=1 FL=1
MTDSPRSSIKVALRAWAAVHRRAHNLGPAAAAFEAAIPGPIRADERFQQALEDAKTAGSLQQAMALNEAEITEWTRAAVALLRAIHIADDTYERELSNALDDYRKSVMSESEGNDANGV